jgi:hypothetical protein
LLAGVWQSKGVKKKANKRRCPICLEEEDGKHILLDSRDTRNCRMKLINDKGLNMNEEIACRKLLKCTIKDQLKI